MGFLVPDISNTPDDTKVQFVATADLNENGSSDIKTSDANSNGQPLQKPTVDVQQSAPIIDASVVTKIQSSSSPFVNENYTNLVSASHVLFATDEWFATADNLVKDSEPVFDPDLYCAEGKVMDGWETRRRRVAGHDWCVIALNSSITDKASGGADVYGIELDTAYFTGNQTPRVSIEVANCYSDSEEVEEDEWKFTWMPGAVTRLVQGGGIQGTGKSPEQVEKAQKACEKFTWTEILGVTELKPGYEESRMHYFTVPECVREKAKGFTHVKVNYFPDGGVARMRLWGHPVNDASTVTTATSSMSACSSASSFRTMSACSSSLSFKSLVSDPELSCEINGGIGLSCSNKHYGVPSNLIREGLGKDMGDGWETARHPERPPVLIKDPKTDLIDSPLMDWAVLKLGMGGAKCISRLILDTKHFKGNFPESVQVEGCDASSPSGETITDDMVCAVTPEMCGHGGHGTGTGTGTFIKDDAPAVKWFPLLNRSRMGPDREHVFDTGDSPALVNTEQKVTHVRISIFPDGGLSRVRIYGQPADEC